MKRVGWGILVLCLAFSMSACGPQRTTVEESNTENEIEANKETEIKDAIEEGYVTKYESEFFTMDFSEKWDGKYDVEYSSDNGLMCWSVNLKKDITGAEGMGYLFSVVMMEEGQSYTNYPEYQFYGLVKFEDLGTYNIIFTFPTDVESTEQCVEIYNELFADRANVIDTFEIKEPYEGAVTILSTEEDCIPDTTQQSSEFAPFALTHSERVGQSYINASNAVQSGYAGSHGFGYGLNYDSSKLTYYYHPDEDSLYGVDENGIVQAFAHMYRYQSMPLNKLWPSNLEWVEPTVINMSSDKWGGLQYCIWKIDNGYLVFHTYLEYGLDLAEVSDFTVVSDWKYLYSMEKYIQGKVKNVTAINRGTGNAENQEIVDAFSESALCELSEQYYCLINGQIPPIVEVDSVNGDIVTIHIYEHMDDHDATWDWYYISKTTGKGTNFMGDEIDLSSLPRD